MPCVYEYGCSNWNGVQRCHICLLVFWIFFGLQAIQQIIQEGVHMEDRTGVSILVFYVLFAA